MKFGGLKVLMISSDRNIAVPGSAVASRMQEYGGLVEELHIVILSDDAHGIMEGQIGNNIWVYPTNSSSKYFRPLDAVRIGEEVIEKRNFVRGKSLITAQDPFECGWAGMKIKNFWRVPLEIQLHTDPFSDFFEGWLNKVRKHIAKKVLKHADGVRVVTSTLKSSISSLTSAESYVLPIYSDRTRFLSAPAFKLHDRYGWSFTILTVARLSAEKNFAEAIKIFTAVRKKYPNTGYVIVGSGPEEQNLKKLVQELNLQNNVIFEGWQENISSYYKTANLYLQTSIFEGYGLSLVEAGLCGLPVVTSAVGIAQELQHGREAYVYYPGATQNFVDGIIDLIEHQGKRMNLGENLKNFLEKKVLSKGEYLRELELRWENLAAKIK